MSSFSDDLIKGSPAVPGGLLMSKPTWFRALGPKPRRLFLLPPDREYRCDRKRGRTSNEIKASSKPTTWFTRATSAMRWPLNLEWRDGLSMLGGFVIDVFQAKKTA